MLYRLLWIIMRAVGAVHWRRINLVGAERLPRDKPVILAANHTNAFYDATLLAAALPPGRRLRFLARADVFSGRLVDAVLRAIGLLPVYRFRDGFGSLKHNDATFEACAAVLRARGTVLIFSEGQCHPVPQLKPLLKGTARLALRAAAEGVPDLVVVPVGINHSAHGQFRQDVDYVFGTPIPAAEWLPAAEEDPGAANRGLTSAIYDQLRGLVVHLDDLSMQDALAEATAMLPLGGAEGPHLDGENWGSRDTRPWDSGRAPGWRLGDDRFNVQRQAWAEALNDPAAGPRLAERIRTLKKQRVAAGLRRMLLPGRTAPGIVRLLLGVLPALLGLLLAWPARAGADALVRRTVRDPQFIDSLRAVYGMLLYGVNSLLLGVAGFWLAWRAGWPVWGSIAVALLLPLAAGWLSLFAFRWHDSWVAWQDQRRWDAFQREHAAKADALVRAWEQLQKTCGIAQKTTAT